MVSGKAVAEISYGALDRVKETALIRSKPSKNALLPQVGEISPCGRLQPASPGKFAIAETLAAGLWIALDHEAKNPWQRDLPESSLDAAMVVAVP